jgi:hypothetical protein
VGREVITGTGGGSHGYTHHKDQQSPPGPTHPTCSPHHLFSESRREEGQGTLCRGSAICCRPPRGVSPPPSASNTVEKTVSKSGPNVANCNQSVRPGRGAPTSSCSFPSKGEGWYGEEGCLSPGQLPSPILTIPTHAEGRRNLVVLEGGGAGSLNSLMLEGSVGCFHTLRPYKF